MIFAEASDILTERNEKGEVSMASREINRPTLKISYNAPVTLTFALLCLIVLGLDGMTGGWVTGHLCSVYRCSLKEA